MTWLSELRFTRQGEFVTVNRPLEGKSVMVFGNGPSLTKETFEALEHNRVILTNNSYLLATRPTVHVALDRRYFQWHGNQVMDAGHTLVTCGRPGQGPNIAPDRYYKFKKDREATVPPDNGTLTGTNSGHAAVALAYLLGAARIYVAGFDMGFRKGKTHWHAPHQVPPSEANYVTRFRPRFEKLVQMLGSSGVTVRTVTPSFAKIPEVSIDEAREDLSQ